MRCSPASSSSSSTSPSTSAARASSSPTRRSSIACRFASGSPIAKGTTTCRSSARPGATAPTAGAEKEDLMSAANLPSAQRIWDHAEAIGKLSELEGGLTRVYLSQEQRAANELVTGWMREAGMNARLDAAGNVVGRYEGERPGLPCLILGSHLDTVRDAGKYDGMLGVIAAIECVRTLHARAKRLPFAIEVIGFADEEGTRFNATLLGSRAVAGTFKPEVLANVDKDGVSMREAMRGFGLDPARIGEAAHRWEDVLAYAELHIEQGPVLEAEGLRRDALAAAAECVLAIERRCSAEPDLVGTVGKLECLPGAVNVIPGKVKFTIDIRSPRDASPR